MIDSLVTNNIILFYCKSKYKSVLITASIAELNNLLINVIKNASSLG